MSNSETSSIIYVIATPIGNLEDMSPRAIRTLKEANIIACEDTRVSRKLLTHFGIHGKELLTYAEHDEQEKAEALIARLNKTKTTLALVSDAGTPCISDPGYRLIRLAREQGIKVVPIPGPSAPMALASVSGLPTDRILFLGFLPTKGSALSAEVSSWESTHATIIFLESARRLDRTLRYIASIYPTATVCIGRELTKLYEETAVICIGDSTQWISSHTELRGEVTVMLYLPQVDKEAGVDEHKINDLVEKAKKAFKSGETLKDLLQTFKGSGLSRSALYQLLLKAKNEE